MLRHSTLNHVDRKKTSIVVALALSQPNFESRIPAFSSLSSRRAIQGLYISFSQPILTSYNYCYQCHRFTLPSGPNPLFSSALPVPLGTLQPPPNTTRERERAIDRAQPMNRTSTGPGLRNLSREHSSDTLKWTTTILI